MSWRPTATQRALAAMALVAMCPSTRAVTIDRRVQHLDAFVEFDDTSSRWTIGNDTVRFAVQLVQQGTIRLDGLSIADTHDTVTISADPEALITLSGETVRLGALGSGFVLEGVEPSEGTHFVALALRFLAPQLGLRATRHYVAYPGTAAIEMWTEVEATDGERHVVENLNAYDLGAPSRPSQG